MAPKKLMRYQYQNCAMTLAEGLSEFHAQIPNMAPSQGFFKYHDICHVMKGLGSTMQEEALADVWTLVATDMKFKDYLAYLKDPVVLELFNSLSKWELISGSVSATPKIVQLILCRRRMVKKWEFYKGDNFLQHSLSELREEFGIQVAWKRLALAQSVF